MIKNDVNIRESISNDYEIESSCFDGRYTKTSLFALKMVGINMYRPDVKSYFVNAFLDDKGFQHDFTRPIFVLFSVKEFEDEKWQKLAHDLESNPSYLTDYDCGVKAEHNLVMFVFGCLEEFKDDYYAFKRGTYSKFSSQYKALFFKTVPNQEGTHVPSIAYGTMYKEKWLKDKVTERLWAKGEAQELSELWPIPIKEREYYRYQTKE